jgi:hypothetical protein
MPAKKRKSKTAAAAKATIGTADLHFEFEAVSEKKFIATMEAATPFPLNLPRGLRDAMIMKLMAHALNQQAEQVALEAGKEKGWTVEDETESNVH